MIPNSILPISRPWIVAFGPPATAIVPVSTLTLLLLLFLLLDVGVTLLLCRHFFRWR
jgi:hypothetical protein